MNNGITILHHPVRYSRVRRVNWALRHLYRKFGMWLCSHGYHEKRISHTYEPESVTGTVGKLTYYEICLRHCNHRKLIGHQSLAPGEYINMLGQVRKRHQAL